MKKRIVLLGPPASGKGTQAHLISTRFDISTASTGAMLRREVAQASAVGIEADRYTATGGFVPDELVVRIVSAWLNDHASAFILDGFPRTVSQAEALEQELQVRQSSLDVAFLLDLSEAEIRRRVLHRLTCDACGATFGIHLHGLQEGNPCPKCGGVLTHRKDDTEEVLAHRLAVYRAKTLPIADFYEGRGLLRKHDADVPPEKLFEAISRELTGEARMIPIKTPREIEKMRVACAKAAEVLARLMDLVAPGITTGEVDKAAAEYIAEAGCKSAFLGYRKFPGHICISLNEEVVHGIGGLRKIQYGDIVKMDVGVICDGWIGDTAVTVPCGVVDAATARLLQTTEGILEEVVQMATEDRHLGDLCAFIEKKVVTAGYSVVREFVGHGVGKKLHEEPQIPNYGRAGTGPRLKSGMTLAIEPMVNLGTAEVKVRPDKWTVYTADGRPSAHFEHTVLVGKDKPEVLTWRAKTLLK